jgi:hypothetical protein
MSSEGLILQRLADLGDRIGAMQEQMANNFALCPDHRSRTAKLERIILGDNGEGLTTRMGKIESWRSRLWAVAVVVIAACLGAVLT